MATYDSTGSLMLPTKKRKADGTIVDRDPNESMSWQQAEEGMKRFHGNVDLYNRPVVSSETMNKAGYNIPAGNTATVYSMQRGIKDKDGKVREVLYTPITATGEVMSQKDIDAYIDSLDGADDILAADKAGKGMIIHLDADPNGNDGQELHLMQEAYGKKPKGVAVGGGGNTVDRHQRKTVTENGVGGVVNATQETEPQLDSYDKMLEYMRANQVADADAAGRARKRELMAAIGDGISAVSSLYQTTKGAPVTYTPGADMSKVMRDRYDRMIAQRKADSDKYLNYLRVQQAKEQADELREYKRTNQEIRREELERQKKNDQAREDYRNMGLRLRDLERQRKIANSPGGDVYFKTLQDMIAEGYSEEDAENEAMKELAAYNTQHGTNYTIVDKRDNSGRVSRTVTVKTNDQQTAGQVEQVANSNVDNAPAPKSKSSGKGKSRSNSNRSGSNQTGGLKPNKLGL